MGNPFVGDCFRIQTAFGRLQILKLSLEMLLLMKRGGL
jgi:hypothetical protein